MILLIVIIVVVVVVKDVIAVVVVIVLNGDAHRSDDNTECGDCCASGHIRGSGDCDDKRR